MDVEEDELGCSRDASSVQRNLSTGNDAECVDCVDDNLGNDATSTANDCTVMENRKHFLTKLKPAAVLFVLLATGLGTYFALLASQVPEEFQESKATDMKTIPPSLFPTSKPPATDFPSSSPTLTLVDDTEIPTLNPTTLPVPLTFPAEIQSSNGELATKLTIAEGSYSIAGSTVKVNGRLLNGQYPGPTLRIKAGDKIRLTYQNGLNDHGKDYIPNMYSGNDESNLHFHGLHVSGELPSDDASYVLEPGENYTYVTTLPETHMAGTYWLHPHRHGSTTLQIGGGALAAIIVEDEPGTLPSRIENARDVLFIAQFFDVEGLEKVVRLSEDPVLSFSDVSENEFVAVNGHVNPVIRVDAGEWIRLRVLFVNFQEEDLDLSIPGCEMQLLAKDGIYIRDFPREIAIAAVPSGGRADIMVRCPDPSTSYDMNGIVDRIATIVTSSNVEDNHALTPWTPIYPAYLSDLRNATVSSGCTCITQMSIYGTEINGLKYLPSKYFHTSYLGAVVERELDAMDHPYHQHVYPFQLIGNGYNYYGNYNRVGDWQDVIRGFGAIRYSPTRFTGKLMIHCHTLNHEDRGMMAVEYVSDESGSCGCGW